MLSQCFRVFFIFEVLIIEIHVQPVFFLFRDDGVRINKRKVSFQLARTKAFLYAKRLLSVRANHSLAKINVIMTKHEYSELEN